MFICLALVVNTTLYTYHCHCDKIYLMYNPGREVYVRLRLVMYINQSRNSSKISCIFGWILVWKISVSANNLRVVWYCIKMALVRSKEIYVGFWIKLLICVVTYVYARMIKWKDFSFLFARSNNALYTHTHMCICIYIYIYIYIFYIS